MRATSWILVFLMAIGSTANFAFMGGKLSGQCVSEDLPENGTVTTKQETEVFTVTYFHSCISGKFWMSMSTKGLKV